MKKLFVLSGIVCLACSLVSCRMLSSSGSAAGGGYLFAHMIPSAYGRLYYSISRDGLTWQQLKNGENVLPEYKGHPDIVRGGDNEWHSIGVVFGKDVPVPYTIHWHSKDLITWAQEALPPESMSVRHLGMNNDCGWFGAPKTCYDPDTRSYIITWHAFRPNCKGNTELWESMRTVYIQTTDFKVFTPARPLFAFSGADENMATIDTILRKVNGTYYAIMKDERWPETTPLGKSIRIAKSRGGVLGPYDNPGKPVCAYPPIHEAPIFTISPTGAFRIYTEAIESPNKGYDLFETNDIQGKWTQKVYNPPKARHGCMIQIDEQTYQKLLQAFGAK